MIPPTNPLRDLSRELQRLVSQGALHDPEGQQRIDEQLARLRDLPVTERPEQEPPAAPAPAGGLFGASGLARGLEGWRREVFGGERGPAALSPKLQDFFRRLNQQYTGTGDPPAGGAAEQP